MWKEKSLPITFDEQSVKNMQMRDMSTQRCSQYKHSVSLVLHLHRKAYTFSLYDIANTVLYNKPTK